MKPYQIIFFLLIAFLVSQCKIEKRLYSKGYYVEWAKPLKRNTNSIKRLKKIEKLPLTIPKLSESQEINETSGNKLKPAAAYKPKEHKIFRTEKEGAIKGEVKQGLITKQSNQISEQENPGIPSVFAPLFGIVLPVFFLFTSGTSFLLLLFLGFLYLLGSLLSAKQLQRLKELNKDGFSISKIVFRIFQSINYYFLFAAFGLLPLSYGSWGIMLLQTFGVGVLAILPFSLIKISEGERLKKFSELSNNEKISLYWLLGLLPLIFGISISPFTLSSIPLKVMISYGMIPVYFLVGSFFVQKQTELEFERKGDIKGIIKFSRQVFHIGLIVSSLYLIYSGIGFFLSPPLEPFNVYKPTTIDIISRIVSIAFGAVGGFFEFKWILKNSQLKN